VKNKYLKGLLIVVVLALSPTRLVWAQTASESGSVGVSGIVSAPAPVNAPIISQPSSGAGYTKVPITVNGICDSDLLVKVFKNGVFSGSAQCSSGSFSLLIDLFNGRNDITARQYDLLDQESPVSAVVSVTYTDNAVNSTSSDRVVLTTNFAKKGADPGQKLIWPFAISGGTGPYAITVEWGDGDNSLYSIVSPGEFSIDHNYKTPGSYTVVVKSVDVNGKTALLQVVAIANGALAQDNVNGKSSSGGTSSASKKNGSGGTTNEDDTNGQPKTRILWQPAAIMIPFVIATFWLGKRYAIHRLRRKIEAGERPFSF
jgi:hypothetical protein